MKIDIEKLNRKTPYPEPSEDFFKQIQANVISQTIGKEPIVLKKEAKVFSLNFKWMAAAAVVLIAGITAFVGLNNDPEISMAQQAPIVDSVYEVEQPIQQTSTELMAKNNISPETQTEIAKPKHLKSHSKSISSDSEINASKNRNNGDRQDYVVETGRKPDSEVEKVLAAFTPDQLKDIDRNSEQDVYLDLYN